MLPRKSSPLFPAALLIVLLVSCEKHGDEEPSSTIGSNIDVETRKSNALFLNHKHSTEPSTLIVDESGKTETEDNSVEYCEEAIPDLNKRIAKHPDDMRNYRNRGICYLMMSDIDLALLDFTKWIEKEPQDAVCLFFLGETLFELERLEEAQKNYEKALQFFEINDTALEDDRDVIQTMLDSASRKIRMIKEAKEKGTSIVREYTDPRIGESIEVKETTTFCEKNIPQLNEKTIEKPDDMGNYRNRGMCLLMTGKIDSALSDFEIWTAKEPENAIGLFFLGETLFELDRLDEAKENYKKALHFFDINSAALQDEDTGAVCKMKDSSHRKIRIIEDAKKKGKPVVHEYH